MQFLSDLKSIIHKTTALRYAIVLKNAKKRKNLTFSGIYLLDLNRETHYKRKSQKTNPLSFY